MDRVTRLVGDVFGKDPGAIADADGPHTISEWDSMGHLNLVLALEAEFALSISADEATNLLTVSAIRELLRARGIGDVSAA